MFKFLWQMLANLLNVPVNVYLFFFFIITFLIVHDPKCKSSLKILINLICSWLRFSFFALVERLAVNIYEKIVLFSGKRGFFYFLFFICVFCFIRQLFVCASQLATCRSDCLFLVGSVGALYIMEKLNWIMPLFSAIWE